MIQTIIFDVDGTLYDETHAKIKADLLTAEYISDHSDYTMKEVYDVYTQSKFKVIKELSGRTERNNRINWYQRTLENLKISNLEANFLAEYYWNIVLENIEVYMDLKMVIEKLSKKYNLYILTDEYFDIQMKKLKKLGIEKYFKKVISSEIIGRTKPDQKLFDYMIDLIGEKREHIAMIGDNPKADVLGAKRAGIKSIWLQRGKYAYFNYKEYQPDRIITNYLELI